MKILYIIDHLRSDGTQKMLSYLVTGLAERGYKQAILSLNDSWDQTIIHRIQRHQVEVRFVGKHGLKRLRGFLTTRRWIMTEGFDVAITMLFWSDVIGRILAKLAGINFLVSSIRARNIHYDFWQRWLIRATMRWVDVLVINSKQIRDFVVQEEGARPENVIYIPNGVPIPREAPNYFRTMLCTELGIPPHATIIGSVGRLTYQKGFDVLLEALAKIQDKNLHLLIVGKGEEKESLLDQAHRLGLDRKVQLLGFRHDVTTLFQILDLYVQPSRFEGMPNAVLEAMAVGCPIIASQVDGICDLIEDGVHGWLVPAEDATALGSAIETILRETDEGKRRGLNSKKNVLENYRLESMVDAWDRLLIGQG